MKSKKELLECIEKCDFKTQAGVCLYRSTTPDLFAALYVKLFEIGAVCIHKSTMYGTDYKEDCNIYLGKNLKNIFTEDEGELISENMYSLQSPKDDWDVYYCPDLPDDVAFLDFKDQRAKLTIKVMD